MEPKRQRQLLVGTLILVIAGSVVYIAWPQPTTTTAKRASNTRSSSTKAGARPTAAPDVALETLNAERPKPEAARDLFRFKPKPPPPPPPAPVVPVRPVQQAPPVPSGPPPPPDIQLKFAGILSQGPVKIAVLLDPLGHSIYGREGEAIEGRYKIWRIGVESIDISYLDGRGRKTIRIGS